MVGGSNTNVCYLGRTFHVQTEDGGSESPQVITLLYEGGAILYSTKSGYELDADDGNGELEERVRQLMEEQHRVMVEALKDGSLDSKIGAVTTSGDSIADMQPAEAFGAGVISDRPLDELIFEHISAR